MHCAGVSCAALALAMVALAALLAGPCAASGCDELPSAAAATNHPSCNKLANTHNLPVQPHEKCVFVDGRPVTVTLYWGSGPARAATALLHALLRHVLRYRRVRVVSGPLRTTDLARQVPFSPTSNYTDVVIALSTAWEPEEAFSWSPSEGRSPGLAGPRLTEFGRSSVPARCHLHARLSDAARRRTDCHPHSRWTFYTNASLPALCDFQITTLHPDSVSATDVIIASDCEASFKRLRERAAMAAVTRNSSRAELLEALREANRSVLFIDYDIWVDEPSVSMVESPPCVSVDANCKQEFDSAIAMRVADTQLLQDHAPRLFKLVYDFKVTTKYLREILDQVANGSDIDEAACSWGLHHPSYFRKLEYIKQHVYHMKIYICNNSEYKTYVDIVKRVAGHIGKINYELGFDTNVFVQPINCSLDQNHIMRNDFTNHTKFVSMLGAVSQAVVGTGAASATAALHRIPLLLVDAVPDDAPGSRADTTWRVAGRPRHVTAALRHFVRHSNWNRLAVLSEPTELAKDYYATLRDGAKFVLREYDIPLKLAEERAMEALQELENTNSRIVFVNTNSDSAAVILRAALERRMSYADGFVWIVRDWRPNNATTDITHFTISLWSRSEKEFNNHTKLRKELGKLLIGRPWPLHTASLANAMLTLAFVYKGVFLRYQDVTYDLHSIKSIRSLNESLSETEVYGVDQRLHYKGGSIEETFVFVDEWRGDKFKRLATWRVNASSGAVRGEYQPPAGLPRDDGRRHCWVPGSDTFYPECYDGALIGALVLLALTTVALLLSTSRASPPPRTNVTQVGEGPALPLRTYLTTNT